MDAAASVGRTLQYFERTVSSLDVIEAKAGAAIYNEIEPYAATWLGNLVAAGHIAQGVVDARSIRDLTASDVSGNGQRHFFAGIGVWSHALRLAGWPDDVPVWTGSCPCQPFSSAGRRGGTADDRHLWPEWFRLIRECCPPNIFGEQVASPDGLGWLDAVRADLEGAGYAFAASDLCAAGVGAPHIRQRLYFVAVAAGERCEGLRVQLRQRQSRTPMPEVGGSGAAERVVDTDRIERERSEGVRREARHRAEFGSGAAELVGDAGLARSGWYTRAIPGTQTEGNQERLVGRVLDVAVPPGPTRGFWSPADWIACRDGKVRPVEPGAFPLAHGATARVGRVRAYGNAIVPQVAATFIQAVMEALAC